MNLRCVGWWMHGLLALLICQPVALVARGGVDLPIVFTQVPAQRHASGSARSAAPRDAHLMLNPLRLPDVGGSRIVILPPGGKPRVLTDGFDRASDPSLSFDGRRMLFAGKRKESDPWNIYEMAIDGSNLRQITRNIGNCRSPSYQSTLYTIVSTEPWYQLTFVSDAAGTLNENGIGRATSLYSCKRDGTAVQRLTYNLSSDVDPFLMGDGRLVYASWQHGTPSHGPFGRVALFAVNSDGTDSALFGDVRGKRFKRMPCVSDRGIVVFVEADRFAPDGSGQVGSITFRRPLRSYRSVTSPQDGWFQWPAPWPDGRVVLSRRPANLDSALAIWLLDPSTGAMEKVHGEAEYDEIQARAVRATREPDGRSSVVNGEDPYGRLYCLDVYASDLPDRSWLANGAVKRLRVLEGVPALEAGDFGEVAASGGRRQPARKRLLGDIEVSADGSFNIQVPANTPIQLQTLDENGMALRTCGWIWARNRERRGCVGCHEDGELTPENVFVEAVRSASIPLTLPPQRRRCVDFRRDLIPVIERKCIGCHGRDGAKPPLLASGTGEAGGRRGLHDSLYYNQAYRILLAPRPGFDGAGRYVDPGRARTSPLIWHLFGKNTSRPWDAAMAVRPAKRIPEGSGPALTNLERQAFVEWVDMGALWDGVPRPQETTRATESGNLPGKE